MAKKRKKHAGGPKSWATTPGILKSVSVDLDEIRAEQQSAADTSWLQNVYDDAQRVIESADHPDDPQMSQAAKRHARNVQAGVESLSKTLFEIADDDERGRYSIELNRAFQCGVESDRMHTRPFEPYVKQARTFQAGQHSGGNTLRVRTKPGRDAKHKRWLDEAIAIHKETGLVGETLCNGVAVKLGNTHKGKTIYNAIYKLLPKA